MDQQAEQLMERSYIEAVTVYANYDPSLAAYLREKSNAHEHAEHASFFWGAYEHDDPCRIWMVGLLLPGEA